MRNFWKALRSGLVVLGIIGALILVVWLLQMLSFESVWGWFGSNWSGMIVGIVAYIIADAVLNRRR